jgi:hypothetical protein
MAGAVVKPARFLGGKDSDDEAPNDDHHHEDFDPLLSPSRRTV